MTNAPDTPGGPARPAFVLGVVGRLSIPGYEDAVDDPERLAPAARQVRDRVWAVLEWLVHESPADGPGGAFDLATGRFDAQASCSAGTSATCLPCGLRSTPIVVLSSLAPGADTLAAEAALDFAAERGVDVTVRAPLSFPLDLYRESTSFRPRGAEATWPAKQTRLDALVARLEAQPGFDAERDLFCVELDEGLALGGDPAADLRDDSAERSRRRLRYRAAGEYVANQSHLLLAIYDERQATPDLADLYLAGTDVTVEAKRRGLSYGLLARSNNFAWVDNGPVFRIPIDDVDRADGRTPCERPMALLHPYDILPRAALPLTGAARVLDVLGLSWPTAGELAPEREAKDDDRDWQDAGDALFRRILARQEEFNGLPPIDDERRALARLLEPVPLDTLSPAAATYLQPLAPLAAVRMRASGVAIDRRNARRRVMRSLAWLILLAALTLGMYEHWIPQRPVLPSEGLIVRDAVGLVKAVLLAATLGALVVSGLGYWRYLRSGAERQRFDFRAIGEGLRVQFYWSLAGMTSSAAGEYMQRQRSELSWIRHVLGALASPTERWRKRFEALEHGTRAELLDAVRQAWVGEQLTWARSAAALNEQRVHRWHQWGWALAAAGVLNVIGKFLGALSPALHDALHHHPYGIGGTVFVVGLVVLFVHAVGSAAHGSHGPHDAHVDAGTFAGWLTKRPLMWGWAFVVGSLVYTAPHVLAGWTELWPGWHEWWMILTGAILLGGALCLAWSERNFQSEYARQFRALAGLHDCADRRLEELIARYRDQAADGAGAERTLAEIHSLLHELGCDALDENADWLILHRTRPLEPFMAG